MDRYSHSSSLEKERGIKIEEMGWVALDVFDFFLAELSTLEEHHLISENSSWSYKMVDMIRSCKSGLRFLRMFFLSILTVLDTDTKVRQILAFVNYTLEDKRGISRKKLVEPSHLENARLEYTLWIRDLQVRIRHCKQKFEEPCELLLQCSLRCYYFEKKPTHEFLPAILENLRDLYSFKTDDEIVLVKNQIETLEDKLFLLDDILVLTPKKWRDLKEMREFMVFSQYVANLVFLYWVKEIDEEMAAKLNLLLFNVLQKIKPCDPVFKAFYFRFLKEVKLGQLNSLILGQFIQIFLDILLESLVDILREDFQILEESLTFVIAFLANQKVKNEESMMMITTEIEVLVKEDFYLVLSLESNTCLSDFMWKLQLVKSKIQQAYNRIRDSFPYDFPKTNGLGFFDFFLQNLGFLKEKMKKDTSFIYFAKHLIIEIEEELTSLRPYLNDLFKQQKEHNELKYTWLKVINFAYRTEYAINSCSVIDHDLWYNMASLMEMLDEIKAVKIEVTLIEGRKTHDGRVLHCSTLALNKDLEDHRALGFNEVIVGLEDEVYIIIEKLKYGSRSLDIVAIVGMAGLGKTTVAKKVYNATKVRNHFHVFAYCIVSQTYSARKILLDILCDIKGKDDKFNHIKDEDLAPILRKCLKGNRYLIIFDDIWDVKAWNEIKLSFPNDTNGSRVIFTTRNHYVSLQAKEDCVIHHLRFMSDEESWDLLQKKAFHAEDFPPAFSEVGKMIAKRCKGLPLTVVLIAGVLAKTERSLSSWNKIFEKLGLYVSTEGFIDLLELSYQHLPEHLKPCFLYFGAFAEDIIIRVNKLMLQWMAEGFVLNSNNENLEIVAKEYLCDLVDRSLIIVDETSSYGGIKSCRIHDQVHEFCQRKAQDENFLQFQSSSSLVHRAYRVSFKTSERYYSNEVCPRTHSLIRTSNTNNSETIYVENLKVVQVLDVELPTTGESTHFMEGIESLVHMRYLAASLSYSTLDIVPSISNLWNLEILILSVSTAYLTLPETIWKMTRLRHVDVGLCYLSKLGAKAFPQMVNLESFSSPIIFSPHVLEDLIQRSPSLRKLSFHYQSKENFHFSKLYSLHKLESLNIFSERNPHLSPFNFPSFRIKKLSLSIVFLDWSYISELSKMPCLEVLKLLDNTFFELIWDMEEAIFPKLKYLKMRELGLSEWIAFSDSFPSMEVLIVNRCRYLKAIPPCFGEIVTLKRIEVLGSKKAATSVVEIQEMQKDSGNEELQVIVSNNSYHE